MSKPAGERWILTVDLPAEVQNAGRFVARILKHLLRAWRVKSTALTEPDEVTRLRRLVNSLSDRCARQAELLARHAGVPVRTH
jgi:hypothetical protein